MAILSHYIGGRVIIKVALFSRLFILFGSFVGMLSLGNRFFVIFWWVNGKIIYYLFYGWISEYIYILFESVERKHNISPNIFFRSNEQKWPSNVTSTTTFYIFLIYDSPHFECNIQCAGFWGESYFSFARLSFRCISCSYFLASLKKVLFAKHIFYHQLIH